MDASTKTIDSARLRGALIKGLALVGALGMGCSAALPQDSERTATESEQLVVTLQNGWTNAPFSTRNAAVWFDPGSGIVHFSGAVANGTSSVLFTLPSQYWPGETTYVPVDLCGAANGRLIIQTNGVVSVQAQGGTFSNAQCFTSLDGAWFVTSTSGLTSLSLQNGWTNAPFSTTAAAIENVGGIAHFKGAIASGTTGLVSTLPVGYRPSTDVYVPVDLCNATKGRLYIQPSGNVTVQAENGTFSNAQCFTSLEGASYSIEGLDASPPFPLPFPQMPSHGGAKLPKLQLQSVTFANDTQGQANAAQFGSFIVGSQWLQQITAEYGPSPFPATNTNQILPAPPSGQLDVASLLLQSLQSHALTMPADTSGLLYMFWVPSAYCNGTSFHEYVTYNGTNIAYTEVCGQTTPYSGSMSHEIAEVITDPYPSTGYFFDANEGGWASQEEVADACLPDWQEGSYQLWSVWSNKAAAAGGSPCLPFPSSATYFNVSPSNPNVDWHVWNAAPLVVPAGGSVQITLQGWSTPVYSGSWTLFTQTPSTNPYALGTQLSTTTMTQNGTATLTLSVPSGAVSGQIAYASVGSVHIGAPGNGSGLWPFAVEVQ